MRIEIRYMKFCAAALALTAMLLSGSHVNAEEKQPKIETRAGSKGHDYKWATGALFGVTICGAYAEYRFTPGLGIRAIGIYIFGTDFNTMNKKEFIVSGAMAPVFHMIPNLPILDPVLMAGIVYSYHHWETRSIPMMGIRDGHTYRQGNIHDVTFGGGFGLNFKFADRLKIGLNIWFNVDYSVSTGWSFKKIKSGRILLPLPLVEFTVQI